MRHRGVDQLDHRLDLAAHLHAHQREFLATLLQAVLGQARQIDLLVGLANPPGMETLQLLHHDREALDARQRHAQRPLRLCAQLVLRLQLIDAILQVLQGVADLLGGGGQQGRRVLGERPGLVAAQRARGACSAGLVFLGCGHSVFQGSSVRGLRGSWDVQSRPLCVPARAM